MRVLSVLFFASFLCQAWGLDNGLALTPPMGWLTWQRYRCLIDCDARPDECISEKLILEAADNLVSGGYLAAGYNYVGIDDCWMEMERDDSNRLVPDKKRFPRGMKFIGDYLHDKGLKFGIYEDFGTKTCAGYPGSLNYMEIDTQTFAEWGADYIKLDGCYVDVNLMDEGYPKFGELINKTGRPMLYSCSWPYYQEIEHEITPDYPSIAKHCNMWRNFDDIQDSWKSVESIIKYFGEHSKRFQPYAGPGHWNDPDMLIVGNFGLSYEQSKVQMAIWSILAAPMLISADLINMDPKMRELLLNKKVLDVNQDKLGKAGVMILEKSRSFVWKREITPTKNDVPSLALAFVNHRDDGTPRTEKYTFDELEINNDYYYSIEDLLPAKSQSWKLDFDKETQKYTLSTTVNPTGVLFLKFTIKNTDVKSKVNVTRPVSPKLARTFNVYDKSQTNDHLQ